MAQVWDDVRQLQGQTLYTLVHQKPFDVCDVRVDRVVFIPHDGNGTERWASREQIEAIITIGRSGKEITPNVVQDNYPNDRNTSYIAAIAHTIVTR